METTQYIKAELLILVPILNMAGALLKSSTIKNKYIPYLLTILSILFCFMYEMIFHPEQKGLYFIFDSIIQGILISSLSVYNHQLFSQIQKRQ